LFSKCSLFQIISFPLCKLTSSFVLFVQGVTVKKWMKNRKSWGALAEALWDVPFWHWRALDNFSGHAGRILSLGRREPGT
jgi:hypothetical protein